MSCAADTFPPLTPQDALVALMVAASASDEDMQTAELIAIERVVNHMPVFADYDVDRIKSVTRTVFRLIEVEEGLPALFGLVRDALPSKLWETGYALACDVVASDGRLGDRELRYLQEIRYELDIDRLIAAAIERGARARHSTL